MNIDRIEIEQADLRKLLSAANGDAALLYLYLRCGNDPANCEGELRLSGSRLSCAAATLRQLGLWPEPRKTVVLSGERPQYSEQDVMYAMQGSEDFQAKADTDFTGYQTLLQGRANVTFKLYENLSHVFVPSVYGDIMKAKQEYGIEQHIGEEVVSDIANWILSI